MVELKPRTMVAAAAGHRTALNSVLERMRTVLAAGCAVAEEYSCFEMYHWVDTMLEVRYQSIRLESYPEMNIQSYFPAANVSDIFIWSLLYTYGR